MSQFERLDAAESIFFARELEHIKAQTYDIKYPALMARTFIPVSNETPSGATTVTYEQFDRVGRSKIIKPGATDLPRVDVKGVEFTRPVRWGGNSYGYNLIEIRQAMMAGKPLDTRKASAARRAHEELVDEVAAIGAPDHGIPFGFINNNTGVAIDAAAGNWSALTGDQIIADVSGMWQAMVADTKGVERANTLLLPDAQHALIATTPRSATTDTTILEFILSKFPGLQAIEPWYRLDGAGVGAVDRGILYRRDPEHLVQDIPNEFEQLPVYQRGSNFEIECLIATAGTTFYYPRSARYIDGI